MQRFLLNWKLVPNISHNDGRKHVWLNCDDFWESRKRRINIFIEELNIYGMCARSDIYVETSSPPRPLLGYFGKIYVYDCI